MKTPSDGEESEPDEAEELSDDDVLSASVVKLGPKTQADVPSLFSALTAQRYSVLGCKPWIVLYSPVPLCGALVHLPPTAGL